MFDTATTTCTGGDPSCRGGVSQNHDASQPLNQGGVDGGVDGKIDKSKPNVLAGSITEPLNYWPDAPGTRTVSWSLAR